MSHQLSLAWVTVFVWQEMGITVWMLLAAIHYPIVAGWVSFAQMCIGSVCLIAGLLGVVLEVGRSNVVVRGGVGKAGDTAWEA